MRISDVERARGALRIGYGLVPIVAGADKFTGFLTDWEKYLAPVAVRAMPIRPRLFMRLVGVVEMGVGLAILTRWPKRGGYVASAWMGAIALNLLASGRYFDIAARDGLLSVGAWALGRLADEKHAEAEISLTGTEGAHLPEPKEPVHQEWVTTRTEETLYPRR